MDAEAYIAERGRLLDAWLDDFVPASDEAPERLHAAMRHLLFPGGKRLRPALAMAAAEAAGAVSTAALPAAAAVELVHTYSLVHDDLPCMDDDRMRRGAPTVHAAFDEATAVLAGDALLTLAFEALTELRGVASGQLSALVRDLARAAGSRGLVGGQADDVAAERAGCTLEQAEIESIHERKSAALIAASIVAGARVAGAPADLLQRLQAYGTRIGVAFQIADDRLDGDGLAQLLGPEEAQARAESLLAGALPLIEDQGERAEPLRELSRFAVQRER
jgi:geranylgeranyl pyrophosphate synthase